VVLLCESFDDVGGALAWAGEGHIGWVLDGIATLREGGKLLFSDIE
jgi:hypothetical protein